MPPQFGSPPLKRYSACGHVNKAVLQRCRPFFTLKGDHLALDQTPDNEWREFYGFWHSIVASANERTFEERLAKFELKYGNEYLDSVGYIKMYWLDPHKEKNRQSVGG